MSMRFALPDLGSIATIVMVPLLLFTWWFTRDRFVDFWKKRFKIILAVTVLIGLWSLWNQGCLGWLQNRSSLPMWALILYSIFLVSVPVAVSRIRNVLTPRQKHYSLYGADWPVREGAVQSPPICSECLMEMWCESTPFPMFFGVGTTIERWKCRECGHVIEWDESEKGNLLEDVNTHYMGELRRAE